MEKNLLSKGLNRLRKGGVKVKFWDGTTASYGPDKPYFTLTIKSPRFIWALARNANLAVGEGYSRGQIEIDGELDQVVRLAIENREAFSSKWIKATQSMRLNRNVKKRQARYIEHHYDLGNDFYRLWLDNVTMAYTCAYFKTPKDTLEQAQSQKLDHVLRKLQLKKGQTVADLGCGWGHLLVRAAKDYGAKGIGVTLSKEQVAYANDLAKREKVDHLVQFKLMNYLDLPAYVKNKQYDRVMSVGMLEHVGRGNHSEFLKVIDQLLKPGSVAVVHSITSYTERKTDAWIDKYIFPGGYIPSVREITALFPKYDLRMIDYENLRAHYVLTLNEWAKRFEKHKKEIIEKYGEEFYRMWRFWLYSSEGSFKYGSIGLSQWVLTKGVNNDLPLTREHIYPHQK